MLSAGFSGVFDFPADEGDMQIQASALALGAVYRGSESRTVEERLEVRIAGGAGGEASVAAPDEVEVHDAKALVARMLYRALTGREAPDVVRAGSSGSAGTGMTRPAAGVTYWRRETVQESEQSVFQAEGMVKLASGEEIAFSVRLEMNRELTVVNGVAMRAGNMQDPIALNFDGLGVRLNGERERFDLNGDGVDFQF